MTGSAFPQGERNKIMVIYLTGKIRRSLQNAHTLKGTMVCCVARRLSSLRRMHKIRLIPHGSRALHLSIFE